MLFSTLPTETQAALAGKAPLRRLADGEIIQQRGDAAREFWLIEHGSVAVGQFQSDGTFRAIALLGPGDSYGELALLTGQPRVVDAVSRGASTVRAIAGAAFERQLAERPAVMRGLLDALARQLQEQLDLMAGIRRGTAEARVAAMLARLAGDSPAPARVRVAQHELGELLGLTRATVNAALRSLEQQGLVARGYGVITIRDPAALRQVGAAD